MVMNGTLSGFLISGLFSFKVTFLGIDLALEIWLFTKLFLYPRFVKCRILSRPGSVEILDYKIWTAHGSQRRI